MDHQHILRLFATAHKVEVNPNFWALSNGLSIEDGSVQKKFTPQLYEQLHFLGILL